jgi:hypothetical protein
MIKDDNTRISKSKASPADEESPLLIPYYHTRIGPTLIGTKWRSAILTKSLDFKDFLSQPPREGEPLSLSHAHTMRKSNFNILRATKLPPLSPLQRKRYDTIFSSIAQQGDRKLGNYRITHAQVEARCRDRGLPSAVYMPILHDADANHDGIFTPPEFATVLHTIQVALQSWHKQQPEQPVPWQFMIVYDARCLSRSRRRIVWIFLWGRRLWQLKVGSTMMEVETSRRKCGREKVASEIPGVAEATLDVVQFSEGMYRLNIELVSTWAGPS